MISTNICSTRLIKMKNFFIILGTSIDFHYKLVDSFNFKTSQLLESQITVNDMQCIFNENPFKISIIPHGEGDGDDFNCDIAHLCPVSF